jgi:hypothetical protein
MHPEHNGTALCRAELDAQMAEAAAEKQRLKAADRQADRAMLQALCNSPASRIVSSGRRGGGGSIPATVLNAGWPGRGDAVHDASDPTMHPPAMSQQEQYTSIGQGHSAAPENDNLGSNLGSSLGPQMPNFTLLGEVRPCLAVQYPTGRRHCLTMHRCFPSH